MSQPFYLGDLTQASKIEALVDGITNLAVDGAQDFLLGPLQRPFLEEMAGLKDQEKRLWLEISSLDEALPEGLYGLSLEAALLLGASGELEPKLDGLALSLRGSPEDVAAAACKAREVGAREVFVQVEAQTPADLWTQLPPKVTASGLKAHAIYRGSPNPEDLEETSLALGYLLEQDMVAGLTLAPALDRAGSSFARSLFNALELKRFGINYVSCPTCGRCRVDLEAITNEVKERTKHIETPMTVAIMGCEVNGPGEARHADIGIASGTESGLLIEGGKAVAKYKESELVDILVERIEALQGIEV